MTKGEAINWLINISADIGKREHKDLWHYEQALFEIREMLEAQTETDQIRWERDTAIQQLKDFGYGLGEKPRTDGDCISRQAAIDAMAELQGRASTKAELKGISKAWKRIKQLSSVQPEPSQVARDIATIIENEKDMSVILAKPQRMRGEKDE